MTIIDLGFLLGLPRSPPEITRTTSIKETKKKTAKSSEKSSESKTVKQTSKKTLKRSNDTKSDTEEPPLPEYAIEVGNPTGFFHIEYKLFPDMESVHIDVLHWDVISKIYFESKNLIYKNMIRENTIWIPIMLQYKIMEPLEAETLLKLKNFVVEIVISQNTKKMSNDAKNEKTKIFYIKKEDITNECYVEAFENDPYSKEQIVRRSMLPLISKKYVRFSMKPIYSITKPLDVSLLHSRFQKIIKKLEKGETINCKQYVPPAPSPLPEEYNVEPAENDVNNYTFDNSKQNKIENNDKNEKNNTKPGRTSTKKSQKVNKNTEQKMKQEGKIQVSGECYLTDAALCTLRLNESVENISDFFVILSTSNLTTPQLLSSLRPIVIKLKSLRNFPVDYLIEQKFSSVYLQYNIPNIARHETQPIILKDIKDGKKIHINEAHIFFDVPLSDFSSFVIDNRLFVELIGVYNDEPDLTPSLFGSQRSDFVRIPPRPSKLIYTKPTSLVLAVACYDLSLFIHSRMHLELIEPFRHPTNTNSLKITAPHQNLQFMSPLTIEQIHLNYHQDHYPSPLVDAVLFEEDTNLHIQVSLGFKLDKFIDDESSVKYKRLLLIVYDLSIANYLISDILCYNQQFHSSVLVKNLFMYTENIKNVEENGNESETKEQLLTGFWIDNGNSIILFLEGCRANYCMEIMHYKVKFMNESLCRVYYNSATYFYKRIYENFVAFGGIYKITLKYQLQKIFQVQWTHISKCVPKPAFEALKKLQYLLEMPSLKVISQHAVFPTVNELLSFDMEFGVPHLNDKLN